jgi:hypothetical protein
MQYTKEDLLAMTLLQALLQGDTPPPASRSNVSASALMTSYSRLGIAMGSVILRGMNTTAPGDRAAFGKFMEEPNEIIEQVTEQIIAAAEKLEAIAAGNETVDLTKML